jgi:malate dehydrogenase (oxaloacetate-decarboxylating)
MLDSLSDSIYTPTVGTAIQTYSRNFRRSEGLFLSYPYRDRMEEDMRAYCDPADVDLIVVTDGEAILGLGDQGVGGILICVGKGTIYTVASGIDPTRILPVVLDVGTNNSSLLEDELYLGWRQKRLTGKEYDDYVDKFVDLAKQIFPDALVHFEDFGLNNAQRLLDHFRPHHKVFNDDITGTGAVVLAAVMSAIKVTSSRLEDQRIVVYGAGSAGMGITNEILAGMVQDGMEEEEAKKHFWLLDRYGLVHEKLEDDKIRPSQKPFARPASEVEQWKDTQLLDVIKNVKPTILIGCSGQGKAFNEEVVKEMSKHVERPVIFPLSNPTSLSEADAADINEWSKGLALIASGSPYPPVDIPGKKKKYVVAQANNALVYPGLGLGTILSKAKRLSDNMIFEGVKALSELSPALQDPDQSLLPDVTDMRATSFHVAKAVMKAAKAEGIAQRDFQDSEVDEIISSSTWEPVYRPLKRQE